MAALEAHRNQGQTGPSDQTIAGYRAVSDQNMEHTRRCEAELAKRNPTGVPALAARYALPIPNLALLRRHPVLVERTTETINHFYVLRPGSPATLVDLDIAHDPNCTPDMTFSHKVVRRVSRVMRVSSKTLLDVLRSEKPNVVKTFVASVFAGRESSSFGLYAALDRFLAVLAADDTWTGWEALAELPDSGRKPKPIPSKKKTSWRFDQEHLDIARDAINGLLELIGLSRQQFGIWQSVPSGSRIKTGPTLFNRQIGSTRDLLILSMKSRSARRRNEEVKIAHWLVEKVEYLPDAESIDFLMQVGLTQLLDMKTMPMPYSKYAAEAISNDKDASKINQAAHTGIASAMVANGIPTYEMLLDVFNNQDLDYVGYLGSYNRDVLRLQIWVHALSPTVLGGSRIPPAQNAWFLASRVLIELLRTQEIGRVEDRVDSRKESGVSLGLVWTVDQVMFLDYCWFLYGYFDGLTAVIAEILKTANPPHDLSNLTYTVHAYQGRWAAMERSEVAFSKFLEDKPFLKELYFRGWKRGPYDLRALGLPFEQPGAKSGAQIVEAGED